MAPNRTEQAAVPWARMKSGSSRSRSVDSARDNSTASPAGNLRGNRRVSVVVTSAI